MDLSHGSITFFIHSSIIGHLGCFHLLVIVNNLLRMWVCKYLFVPPLSLLLGMYPEVGLLDHRVTLWLTCWRTAMLFSTAATYTVNFNHPLRSSSIATSSLKLFSSLSRQNSGSVGIGPQLCPLGGSLPPWVMVFTCRSPSLSPLQEQLVSHTASLRAGAWYGFCEWKS